MESGWFQKKREISGPRHFRASGRVRKSLNHFISASFVKCTMSVESALVYAGKPRQAHLQRDMYKVLTHSATTWQKTKI